MFAVKNEHLIFSFLAITPLLLLLLYFSNETIDEAGQKYPRMSRKIDKKNESYHEKSIDFMPEQVRENCIINDSMNPVTR